MVGTSPLSFTIHATYTASSIPEYPKTSHIVKCLQPDSTVHVFFLPLAFFRQLLLFFIVLLGGKQKAYGGLQISCHPLPEGKRQWQRAPTKGIALAWRVCVPHCVTERLYGVSRLWWQSGRHHFGETDVPAMFPGHPLGHSHDYTQTLPFKMGMGMGMVVLTRNHWRFCSQ